MPHFTGLKVKPSNSEAKAACSKPQQNTGNLEHYGQLLIYTVCKYCALAPFVSGKSEFSGHIISTGKGLNSLKYRKHTEGCYFFVYFNRFLTNILQLVLFEILYLTSKETKSRLSYIEFPGGFHAFHYNIKI